METLHFESNCMWKTFCDEEWEMIFVFKHFRWILTFLIVVSGGNGTPTAETFKCDLNLGFKGPGNDFNSIFWLFLLVFHFYWMKN